jgi:acyl carrier protein
MQTEVTERVRRIVKEHAGLRLPLEEIQGPTDLYRAGMTSQSSVVLMIALEAEFGVEFPDAMLSRDIFANVDAISNAVRQCEEGGAQ